MIIGAIIGDITNDSSSIQNLLAVCKAMIETEPYYDKLKERIGRSIKKQKLFPEQIIILALLSSNIVFRGSVKAVARIIAESFTEDENVIKSAEINADIVHMLANNSSLQDVKEYLSQNFAYEHDDIGQNVLQILQESASFDVAIKKGSNNQLVRNIIGFYAEAFYGVSNDTKTKILSKLSPEKQKQFIDIENHLFETPYMQSFVFRSTERNVSVCVEISNDNKSNYYFVYHNHETSRYADKTARISLLQAQYIDMHDIQPKWLLNKEEKHNLMNILKTKQGNLSNWERLIITYNWVNGYNHIPLWVIEHGKINKKQYNKATKKEGLSLDLAIVDYNFLPDIG